MVMLEPSSATDTTVDCGSMPSPADGPGPATNIGFVGVPTSEAWKVPTAAVRVVAPATQDTPARWAPGAGRVPKLWVYVNDPVAVPSVVPIVTPPTLAFNPPVRAKFTCWYTPAMIGPINVSVAVPLTPNDVPAGDGSGTLVFALSPRMKGAV